MAFSEYLNFLKTYLFLFDYLLTLNGLWIQGGHHKICQHLFGREVSKMRTQISKKSGEPVWEGSIILYEVIYGCPPPPISSNFLVVGTHLPSQLWNAQDFRRSQQIQHALQLLRGVILGGAGGAMAPPDFGTISTSGSRLCSPNNIYCHPRIFRPSYGPELHGMRCHISYNGCMVRELKITWTQIHVSKKTWIIKAKKNM